MNIQKAPKSRSEIMAAVKSYGTAPEILVRRIAHGLGYRFVLHGRNLPGTPDLVFPSRFRVIFVHGCFWHGHTCPRGSRVPKTNRTYWAAKIVRNRKRDRRVLTELKQAGWKSLTIWECEMKSQSALEKRLRKFFSA